jgi:hypothetical protein
MNRYRNTVRGLFASGKVTASRQEEEKMVTIRLAALMAMLVLAACGTAGSTGGVGQPGGVPARAVDSRPAGWDMLDASLDPNASAGAFVAPSVSWCDAAGICVSQD